jgi:hypothetical protein
MPAHPPVTHGDQCAKRASEDKERRSPERRSLQLAKDASIVSDCRRPRLLAISFRADRDAPVFVVLVGP